MVSVTAKPHFYQVLYCGDSHFRTKMIHYFEFWRLRCLFIAPASKNIQTSGTLKLRRHKRCSPAPSSVKISCISVASAGLVGFFFLSQGFRHKRKHTGTRSILLILLNSSTDILQSNGCYGVWRCFQTLSPLLTYPESSPTAEFWSTRQRGVSRVCQIAS